MQRENFSIRKVWEPASVVLALCALMGAPLSPSIGIPIVVVIALIWIIDFLWVRNPRSDNKPPAIPDLQASASEIIRNLSTGVERDRLIGLLQSGEVTAWSRTKGYRNLRAYGSERWVNDSLEYVDTSDSTQTTILSPEDLRERPWRKDHSIVISDSAYDVHFNKAQLKKHWPALF